MRRMLLAALALLAVLAAAGCPRINWTWPPPEPTAAPSSTATPTEIDGQQPTATPLPPTSTPSPSGGRLSLVRRWNRPATTGQRVRLGSDAQGHLLVAYTLLVGGHGIREAHLETAEGVALWSRTIVASPPEYFPLSVLAGSAFGRDADKLLLRDSVVGSGAFEAYAGYSGAYGAAVIGWQPCAARPCPATVFYRPAGQQQWSQLAWAREIFGLDMGADGEGRLAIATRENPSNRGWTLRTVDEALLCRHGELMEAAPAQAFTPPKNLSLEDPMLVPGAAVPAIVGEAYDVAHQGPSGRIFLAEAGGELREVLTVGATLGNAEIGAVMLQGTLYVAAETAAGHSALYRWRTGRGLEILADEPGGAPSLGLAEGTMFLATEQGLWRLE